MNGIPNSEMNRIPNMTPMRGSKLLLTSPKSMARLSDSEFIAGMALVL